MAKGKSRPKRWADAITALSKAIDNISNAVTDFEAARDELYDIQQEYQEWYDNMPEGLQQSPTGELLEAVCDLTIEGVEIDITEAESMRDEAEGIDLPRGFGKD